MSTTTATIATTTLSASGSPTQTCTNPQPGKHGYLPPEACNVILYYVPSTAAAILFVVLFSLTLITHIIQAFLFKKRYAWVIIMGATWELLAFVLRTLLTFHQDSDGYDTGHVLLFLLAPLWINAFVYMTLGRMIYYFLPDRRLANISASRYGTVFIWLDIFAFIIQAAGAVLTTDTDASTSLIMTGIHIYMGGIGVQQFFILTFGGLAIRLHLRVLQLERQGELRQGQDMTPIRHWRRLFYSLYFVLIMITIRIIFRLCQYSRGTDPNNPILTHEAYEYVLDAVPMFLALAAVNLIHPGMILRGPNSEFPRLSRKEKRQLKRDKKEQKKERKEQRRKAKEDLELVDPVLQEQQQHQQPGAGWGGDNEGNYRGTMQV